LALWHFLPGGHRDSAKRSDRLRDVQALSINNPNQFAIDGNIQE